MFKKLFNLLFLLVFGIAAQQPYAVRIVDNGHIAEVVDNASAAVIHKIEHTRGAFEKLFASGIVSNDGKIVILQRTARHQFIEVFDFSAEEDQYCILRSGHDPKFSFFDVLSKEKPTIMIKGRMVFALGSYGLSSHGLLLWNLDHLEPSRFFGHIPNKVLAETKPGDRIEKVGNRHVYIRTQGWFKSYVYKASINEALMPSGKKIVK